MTPHSSPLTPHSSPLTPPGSCPLAALVSSDGRSVNICFPQAMRWWAWTRTPRKLKLLQQGRALIHEDGLQELLEQTRGRLRFTDQLVQP